MDISRGSIYIFIIFVIQLVFIIIIPYIMFGYFAHINITSNKLFDQITKAFTAFILVGIWLLEWMYLGNYSYRRLKRSNVSKENS